MEGSVSPVVYWSEDQVAAWVGSLNLSQNYSLLFKGKREGFIFVYITRVLCKGGIYVFICVI